MAYLVVETMLKPITNKYFSLFPRLHYNGSCMASASCRLNLQSDLTNHQSSTILFQKCKMNNSFTSVTKQARQLTYFRVPLCIIFIIYYTDNIQIIRYANTMNKM
jgi:hypothetical protein